MKTTFYILIMLLTFSPFLSAQKLLDAVEAKNYQEVEQLISSGEKVNKPDKEGQFALWKAVWNQDIKMVNLLLKNGADAKQQFNGEKAKIACLQIAAQEGLVEITKLLVDAGADVHLKGSGAHTPLRIASRNGHIELVKYFLSKGSEVDTRGDDGATPLEHAASKGHLEIVVLLVEAGADINIQDKEKDFPLGEAAKKGFIDVVNYLLSKGADTSLKNQDGDTAEDLPDFRDSQKSWSC